MIPVYIADALLRRRTTARLNGTPLPTVVMHGDFIRAVITRDDNCAMKLDPKQGATIYGMRLRADDSVPFGEIWYE